MRRTLPLALASAALLVLAAPLVAQASDPFLEVLSGEELDAAPSQRYGRMGRDEAIAELRARGAIFDEIPADKAPGVLAPVRLTSRLSGLFIHGAQRETERAGSPFEILDARLALTLHDFAAVLARHDVDEIVHYTMYRPPAPPRAARAPGLPVLPRGTTPGKPALRPRATAAKGAAPARRAEAPHERAAEGAEGAEAPSGQTTSRHPAGLAIDVGLLKKKGGGTLNVATQFGGKIGAKTCGDRAQAPSSPEARELRSIVCEAASSRLFTYVLTPNFNAAHRDHFHMEIKPGVAWVLTH